MCVFFIDLQHHNNVWGWVGRGGRLVMISVRLSDLATKLNPGILSAAVNPIIVKLLCYAFDGSIDRYAFDRSFDFRRRFIRL